MARHASPDMTFNVYGRARHNRMAEAVERIATRLSVPDRVPSVYRQAAVAERENATAVESGSCASQIMVEPRGIEPLSDLLDDPAVLWQICANSMQVNAFRATSSKCFSQTSASTQHDNSTSLHAIRALCVHMLQKAGMDDLADIVSKWHKMPEQQRRGILSLAGDRQG